MRDEPPLRWCHPCDRPHPGPVDEDCPVSGLRELNGRPYVPADDLGPVDPVDEASPEDRRWWARESNSN